MDNRKPPTNAASNGAKPTVSLSPDPVPRKGIFALGLYFFILALLTFYLLVATWPVSDTSDASGYANFSLFGWPFSTAADRRLFLTVIAAGALGSLLHAITSFADYVGNRTLSRTWVWWLVLRTPIGVALALLFYLVLRGGLIVPSLPNAPSAADTTHLVNPYGIAAISAMAGMFSKQATDKLREIFDTLFRTREPVTRADPLLPAKPAISSTEPPRLTVGVLPVLNVFGRGFQSDCTVSVNGKSRNVQWVSDTRLVLTLLEEDVASSGRLQVIVHNPGPSGETSEPFNIQVEMQPSTSD
jgi:hypothetical protein